MPTPRGTAGTPLKKLVYSRERIYYGVMVVVSLGMYAGLVMWSLAQPETGATYLVAAIVLPLIGWYAHGMALGHVRGNAVRVSDKQFPQLYRLTVAHARRLELKEVPAVYVLQSGGVLNAFATRFSGRDFVVINSDVLELALDQGEAAVGFIGATSGPPLARDTWAPWWLCRGGCAVSGKRLLPACEYTCDPRAACQPDGAISGLLALAAGKLLHSHVDVREFAAQAEKEQNFWTRRVELMSSHPLLPKRVAALLKAGVAIPARSQVPMTEAPIAA